MSIGASLQMRHHRAFSHGDDGAYRQISLEATHYALTLEARVKELEAKCDQLRIIANVNGDWNLKYASVVNERDRIFAETREAAALVCEARAKKNQLTLNSDSSKARITAVGGACWDLSICAADIRSLPAPSPC